MHLQSLAAALAFAPALLGSGCGISHEPDARDAAIEDARTSDGWDGSLALPLAPDTGWRDSLDPLCLGLTGELPGLELASSPSHVYVLARTSGGRSVLVANDGSGWVRWHDAVEPLRHLDAAVGTGAIVWSGAGPGGCLLTEITADGSSCFAPTLDEVPHDGVQAIEIRARDLYWVEYPDHLVGIAAGRVASGHRAEVGSTLGAFDALEAPFAVDTRDGVVWSTPPGRFPDDVRGVRMSALALVTATSAWLGTVDGRIVRSGDRERWSVHTMPSDASMVGIVPRPDGEGAFAGSERALCALSDAGAPITCIAWTERESPVIVRDVAAVGDEMAVLLFDPRIAANPCGGAVLARYDGNRLVQF